MTEEQKDNYLSQQKQEKLFKKLFRKVKDRMAKTKYMIV